MTTLNYCSGDEILPGDTVECADGMKGEVTAVFCSVNQSGALDCFYVKKGDGTRVAYQPSDQSVRLLSRVTRMTSLTMNANIKKKEFLELLKALGSHSFYYPDKLSKRLADCGLSTGVVADGQGLIVEGQLIPLSTPEWGEPGISTLAVLSTVYELATGAPPRSDMSGRGFWYEDVMDNLASFWVSDQ